ncbi:hypothetical protein RHS01_10831 [Rhizoctonia solani]|uniref:Uncharacterized protein n=1 Tax=Rhizoctonia solani TaxID=456999 RepID=A0A8H7I348_9AGAM|nr:hypothetical protein RHS01_10831 [Rhizoctonia solani]
MVTPRHYLATQPPLPLTRPPLPRALPLAPPPCVLPRWPLLPANTFHGNPLPPPSRTRSPIDQGDLGPFLPSAAPVELGEVSLERVTRLLLGLLGQVERLKREVGEIKEAGIETRTNVENISQAVDVVKDGLRSLQSHGPRTPEDTNLRSWKQRHPLSKVNPIGLTSWVSFWPKSSKGLPIFAQPTPVRAVPRESHLPSISASPIPHRSTCPPPPAPVAAYPAPVKVDHPDAYTGK